MLIQNGNGMTERAGDSSPNHRTPIFAIRIAATSRPNESTKNRRASKPRERTDGEIDSDTAQPRKKTNVKAMKIGIRIAPE